MLGRFGPPDAVEIIPTGTVFQYVYDCEAGSELELSAFRATFQYSKTERRVERLRIEFDQDGVARAVALLPAPPP